MASGRTNDEIALYVAQTITELAETLDIIGDALKNIL